MKKNNKNFARLLQAKIIKCREMEDFMNGKGAYDRAQAYRKERWILEDILEIFTDSKAFNEEVKMNELTLWEMEERGL